MFAREIEKKIVKLEASHLRGKGRRKNIISLTKEASAPSD